LTDKKFDWKVDNHTIINDLTQIEIENFIHVIKKINPVIPYYSIMTVDETLQYLFSEIPEKSIVEFTRSEGNRKN